MTPGDHIEDGGRAQDEVIAGEYVLGVLSAEARQRVDQRMKSDQNFSLLVQRWQSNFSSFDEDYQQATPSGCVCTDRRAAVRCAAIDRRDRALGRRKLLALGIARHFVRGGRGIGICVRRISAVLVARPVVAQLSAPDNRVNLLASFDASSGRLRIVPVAAGRAQEKSLQLWFVPGSGNPQSLGVFEPNADGELLIPADLRQTIGAGATLAVSLEPFGGSRTGLPTGPIVASGTARQL